MKFLILFLISTNLYSRAYNYRNNPLWQINKDFIITLDKLPTSGFLPQKPWTDNYWPHYDGGTTARWNAKAGRSREDIWDYKLLKNFEGVDLSTLSPSEKYDLYIGDLNYPTTLKEREYSKIETQMSSSPKYDPDYVIDAWAGICNAWSEAVLSFENPKPVLIKGKGGFYIPFGSSDIKGLLASMLDSDRMTSEKTIGERCYEDIVELWYQVTQGGYPEEDYYNIAENGACEDVNAGAFHIVLTNQIGLLNTGFIMDIDRGVEVWNQPVYGYELTISPLEKSEHDREAPGTTKLYQVLAKVYYVQENQPDWRYAFARYKNNFLDYSYIVEVDKEGKIIGGTWLSDTRPDIVWIRNSKKFQGSWAQLKEIYEKSIAQTDGGIPNGVYTQKSVPTFPNATLLKSWKRPPPKYEWPSVTIFKKWERATKKGRPNPAQLVVYEGSWPHPRKLEEDFLKAVKAGNKVEASKLIQKGARVNVVTKDKENALLIAVANNNRPIVDLLFANGGQFSINVQDKDGRTPLLLLLNNSQWFDFKKTELIKKLLSSNASVTIKDNSGKNALDYIEPLRKKPWGNKIFEMFKNSKY
jgi:Transglutaminase elicitor/Ankyrin repeats (3 copies)